MRDTFLRVLLDIARENPRVILMTGDLGFKVLDEFRAECPRQFYNVGVAEQNLTGVAAGLALTGHVVFTYSIGNFPTLRCLEQVRNDVCYHNADVKIVTVGGGMAYGSLGFSHFATEDLAILRALPGMTVVAPGDPTEVEKLVPQIADQPEGRDCVEHNAQLDRWLAGLNAHHPVARRTDTPRQLGLRKR